MTTTSAPRRSKRSLLFNKSRRRPSLDNFLAFSMTQILFVAILKTREMHDGHNANYNQRFMISGAYPRTRIFLEMRTEWSRDLQDMVFHQILRSSKGSPLLASAIRAEDRK
jgi:hypothetical protein